MQIHGGSRSISGAIGFLVAIGIILLLWWLPIEAAMASSAACKGLPKALTQAESKLSTQICGNGQSAVMTWPQSSVGQDLLVRGPIGLKDWVSRCQYQTNKHAVRAIYLQVILNDKTLRRKLLNNGELRIRGVTVLGELESKRLIVASPLVFESVLFCGTLDLSRGEFSAGLSIEESVFVSKPSKVATGARQLGARFGAVILNGIRTGGSLRLHQSTLSYVDGRNISSLGNIEFTNNIVGHVNFRHASTVGEFSFNGTRTSTDELFTSEISIHGTVDGKASYLDLGFISSKSKIVMDFVDSNINLILFGSKARELSMLCSNVGAFDLREVKVENSVTIAGTSLGSKSPTAHPFCSDVSTLKARKRGLLAMNMSVGGDLSLKVDDDCADWRDMSTNPQSRALVNESLCLNGSKIDGSLELVGATLARLELSNARINGAMKMSDGVQRVSWNRVKGAANICVPQLDMRATEFGVIESCFSEQDWPARYRWIMGGATVSTLNVLACSGHRNATIGQSDKSTRLERFLEGACYDFEGTGPYRLIQNVAKRTGWDKIANDVAFAAEDRITSESDWITYLGRQFQRFFGGYGVKAIYPSSVAILFAISGAIVAYVTHRRGQYFADRAFAENTLLRGLGPQWKIGLECLVFSIDRLIPVLTLLPANKRVTFEGSFVARMYFAMHAFVGWLLAGAVTLFVGQLFGVAR